MDRVFGIGLMCVSGVALYISQSFPKSMFSPVHPGTFPSIIAIGLFVCGALLTIQAFRAAAPAQSDGADHGAGGAYAELISGGLFVLLLIGLAATFEMVGFALSSGVAALALAYYQSRRILVSIVTAIAVVAAVYVLFKIALAVPLP